MGNNFFNKCFLFLIAVKRLHFFLDYSVKLEYNYSCITVIFYAFYYKNVRGLEK